MKNQKQQLTPLDFSTVPEGGGAGGGVGGRAGGGRKPGDGEEV